MNRAVFLDRDGVINETCLYQGKPVTPSKVEEFRILPGVKEALTALKRDGYYTFVVTNQPEIRRGTLTPEELEKMHRLLSNTLPIDKIYVCMHDDQDRCECRKPKPGMLLQAAKEWSIDLTASYMIGDRWKDMEAGAAAGCTTILVRSPWSAQQPSGRTVRGDYTVDSLIEAAKIILSRERRESNPGFPGSKAHGP